MAIRVKDPEIERLARALAEATGEPLGEALRRALRERLVREQRRRAPSLAPRVREIQERLARVPVLDARTPEEIVGFDDHGVAR